MPGFNPFRYRFPYTNINDINLDWIIKKVKALSDAVASIDVSRMDEIAEQAETAQQDAETALATAQSAETTANSVQSIANSALTTAQSAETTAQSAETTANSVQGIANNALTTAQSAETTAQSAETTANSVQGIANNALTTANNAINGVNTLNASKADKVSGATLGNFASLAANGNLLDSGYSNSDYAPAAAAIPVGGAAGQVLTKTGSADYAAAWQLPSGGGDVAADMLGIVIDGNSTSVGASVGQYVIVKNSTISGITDGLYKAAQTIPANTSIDSTYLTAVSGGGLNDLSPASVTFNVYLLGMIFARMSAGQRYFGIPIPLGYSSFSTSLANGSVISCRDMGSLSSVSFTVSSISGSIEGPILKLYCNGTGLESHNDVVISGVSISVTLSK